MSFSTVSSEMIAGHGLACHTFGRHHPENECEGGTVSRLPGKHGIMPYSLSFSQTDDYLHAIWSGEFQSGDSLAMWNEVNEYLASFPQKRLLIEEQAGTRGSVTTMETYAIGEFLADNDPLRLTRIAVRFPARTSQGTLEDARFGETVARNRGAQVEIFLSRDEAEKWLIRGATSNS